jgi:hypothetical protein
MSELRGAPSHRRVSASVRLRLAGAMLALAAGASAVVIAILLVRSTLS